MAGDPFANSRDREFDSARDSTIRYTGKQNRGRVVELYDWAIYIFGKG